MQKLFVVIPAFNEEKQITRVIQKLKEKGYSNIIVVDDGSTDKTYELAKSTGAIALKHLINRGLGGALATGFQEALNRGAGIIVTFDADGQHRVADIKRVTKRLLSKEADVVIGSRLGRQGMPISRRIGNFGLNMATFVLFGAWCADTQSGLRAFTREALKKIDLKTNRMEVSSEIISEIGKNNLRLKEMPIKAVYTKYSLKKGQSFYNGFKIFAKLVVKKIME